jgi:cell division protein FtsX
MRRIGRFALFACLMAALLAGVPAAAVSSHRTVLPRSATDREIFMKVDATRAQVAAVRKAIAHDHDVIRFSYLDHETALEEFQRIFRRNEDLSTAVTAADLPESFRLAIRDRRAHAVQRRYEKMKGVDSVEGGSTTPSDEWTIWKACSRIAYDLEVVMLVDATPEQLDTVAATARAAPDVDKVEVTDATEVAAIVDCVAPGAHKRSTLPLLIHVALTDPAAATARSLEGQLEALPGVKEVNHDPQLGEPS